MAKTLTGGHAFGLLLLRLGIGAGIALHGGATIFAEGGMQGMAQYVGSLGFPVPVAFAWAAKLSELIGGICLVIGAFTRPAALFIAVTMGVAAFVAHASDPWLLIPPVERAKELPLLYLVGSAALLFAGPGPIALDNWLSNRLPRFLGGKKKERN